MPRKTIQMWLKICTSSLQLNDEFSAKQWKTCSSAMPTIRANSAATKSSTTRSTLSSRRCIAALLLADLCQQRLGAEVLGQLVLRSQRGLLQRCDVDLFDLHAQLLHGGQG